MILFKESFFSGLNDLLKKKPRNINFGPTSWNYEGWKGIVYWRRYRDSKEFRNLSIEEVYKFPLFSFVEIDFTYYSYPSSQVLAKFQSSPPDFPLVFKVPKTFMDPSAGDFLNFEAFKKFLHPFKDLKDKKLIFHFQFSYLKENPDYVRDKLLDFVAQMASSCAISVEFRNPAFLRFWDQLVTAGLIPTLNHWTYMPPLCEQAKFLPKNLDKVYVRLLTPRNVSYSEAVKMFQPYREIKQRNFEARKDVKQLILNLPARQFYIAVNNRFEGCGPLTIKELLEEIVYA